MSIGTITDQAVRRSLIAAYTDAVAEARRRGESLGERPGLDVLEEFGAALDVVDDRRRLYRETLPVRTVSRCPFTGIGVHYPIDDAGLEGPWWDFHNPVRTRGLRPGTCYSITGAMRLGRPFEYVPHVAIVGPAVPYVLPRLLEVEGSVAVVSSLPVGPHTGYVISYFAPPGTEQVPTADEWGTGRWLGVDGTGAAIWTSTRRLYQEADDAPLDEERDASLERWITEGRVRWIAPGDDDATLRDGGEGCPYLGLEGALDDQWVIGVWST